MNTVTVIALALLGLLVFLLGVNVTRHRAARGRDAQVPTAPDDELLIAIRAHGNAAEYVPTLMLLVVICSSLTDGWWVAALAVAAVAVRVVHAVGLLTGPTLAEHGPLRDLGAAGTYVVGVTLSVTAVVAGLR